MPHDSLPRYVCKFDLYGSHFWPAPKKVQKWLAAINGCMEASTLQPGQAAKLASQLQWTCQCTFQRLISIRIFNSHINPFCSRLGRASLRPIIDQSRARSSEIGPALKLSLQWWCEVLSLQLRQRRDWKQDCRRQVHLCVEARSTPPHLAAVLFKYHYLCLSKK